MSTYSSQSGFSNAITTFDSMLSNFGIVTVMNAKIYKDSLETIMGESKLTESKVADILAELEKKSGSSPAHDYVELKHLKVANISQEGPTKTITGGQYNNVLLKYGKTARVEMQDALGNTDALEALGIGFKESFTPSSTGTGNASAFHVGNTFSGPKTIVGDSFFIDQENGAQVKVKIILYQFLPDSLLTLSQSADGDATVFDMNGDLLSTDILVGSSTSATTGTVAGVFYSIVPADPAWTAQQ